MPRILIVDDTKSVHAFVRALLSKSKTITTESVYDGVQAVERLKQKNDFDIIFLDWEMPNLNGPDALQEIKSLGINTPVLMMTSKNAPEDIARVLELGASEYLMKPFTVDILFEKMSFVLGRAVEYAA